MIDFSFRRISVSTLSCMYKVLMLIYNLFHIKKNCPSIWNYSWLVGVWNNFHGLGDAKLGFVPKCRRLSRWYWPAYLTDTTAYLGSQCIDPLGLNLCLLATDRTLTSGRQEQDNWMKPICTNITCKGYFSCLRAKLKMISFSNMSPFIQQH